MASKELYTELSNSSHPAAGSGLYSRYSQWRAALDLPSPGTIEALQREVKCKDLPSK